MAGQVLGANGLVNLFELTKLAGELEAYSSLRNIVRQAVSVSSKA
jgi:hypothetical protein